MAKKKKSTENLGFYAKIGKRIKELRIKDNSTQKEIAQYLNISQEIIARYEKGNINIPFHSIIKLCEIFGVSIDYLLAEPDSMEEYSAKYKIDLEGLSLAIKYKEDFNDEPYEMIESLKKIFFYVDTGHDILELALVKEIFRILSVNLKIDIPFERLLDRNYRNDFIIKQISDIYSSKNDKTIKRLNWNINLTLFIFGYIDIAENIETYKEGE